MSGSEYCAASESASGTCDPAASSMSTARFFGYREQLAITYVSPRSMSDEARRVGKRRQLTSPFQELRVRVESTQTTTSDSTDQRPAPVLPFPALQGFGDLLAKHGATKISLQVNHKPASSTASWSHLDFDDDRPSDDDPGKVDPVTHPTEPARTAVPGGGPSGVSVRVDFVLEDEQLLNKSDRHDGLVRVKRAVLERSMRHILRELHARRILLAPVAATSFEHTSRLHPRPFLIHESFVSPSVPATTAPSRTAVSVTYVLPTEGSPWSSEGLRAFLRLSPCHDHRRGRRGRTTGLWSAASPSEWSHRLLGTPGRTASPAASPAPTPGAIRRMWIEASLFTSEEPEPNRGPGSPRRRRRRRHSSLSTGVEYSVTVPAPPSSSALANVTLRSVLPNADASAANRGGGSSGDDGDDDSLRACPIADATTLVVVRPAGVTSVRRDENPSHETRVASLASPIPLFESIESLLNTRSDLGSSSDSSPSPLPTWSVRYAVQPRDGQANRGTLRSTIVSSDPSCPARVEVHQVLPAVVRPVWQSLRVHVTPANGTSSMEGGTPRRIGWKELEWSDLRIDDDDNDGSEVRTIRWSFRHVLPPSTALEVAVDYEPAFLNFERFPADPNRGFELPPFVARFSSTGGCGGCPDGADPAARCPGASATLHSGSPLLLAPVPDMSMPFNVVSLGCTLYAFVIGSLIHLVVRRGSERVKHALNPEERPASPAQRVKAAVLGRWRALAVAGWAPRRRRPARGLATPAQAEGSAQDATPADDGT